MFNLLLFVLTGAATMVPPVVSPVVAEQPEPRITLSARPFFPGSKPASSFSQRFTLGSGPTTWYVFTGKTICESQTVSAEKPAFAGNGWRVDLKPGAVGSKSIQLTWERLWVGGKPSSGGGTRAMAIGSGTPLVLDSIDGGARLRQQEELERLRKISPSDLDSMRGARTIEGGRSTYFESRISELEKRRQTLVTVQGLGPMNPQVVSVDGDLAAYRRDLKEVLAENLANRIALLMQPPPSDAVLVDGCDALSMNLQITAEAVTAREPTETEIWLVHKDTAGLETVQRQVVRSATGNGSYVFDDIVVKTERGPITIEVYGDLGVETGVTDGALPYLRLGVSRRYVTSGTAFTWKTKEGGTAFAQVIRPDEVVAFNLLPLKDDEGVLVGHRFSVRVRTKILK